MNTGYGTLSVVATPIGNLEDITLRALRTLREVNVVLAEDTRVTGKLLQHYGIATALKRCDAHAEAACAKEAILLLEEGKRVAYVTDAGTPGISDPGARLVRAVRDALPGAVIEAIPGPSSVTAALSIAGVTETPFSFLGFAPHKKGRETFFDTVAGAERPVVFFESTHRIMKTLDSLAKRLPPDRRVSLAREITKLHEEVLRGSAAELLAQLSDDVQKQRGEFVVIVDVL